MSPESIPYPAHRTEMRCVDRYTQRHTDWCRLSSLTLGVIKRLQEREHHAQSILLYLSLPPPDTCWDVAGPTPAAGTTCRKNLQAFAQDVEFLARTAFLGR